MKFPSPSSLFAFARDWQCRQLGLAAVCALLLMPLAACSQKDAAKEAGKDSKVQAAAAGFEKASAAEEQTIRRGLAERLKQLPPIDEVRRTVVSGLFEVRFGGQQIIYTDSSGRFIVEGSLIDTQTMANLTEERLDALTAVAFDQLPLKDALVYKQGDGSRRIAVFGDPNCGFCKRFERDLLALPNVTIYTFIMPILGADSTTKARNIWCSADAARAWRGWMIDGVAPAAAGGACDAEALVRNAAFGRKHRINGTPAIVFADGTRRSGAMPMKQVEEMLAAQGKKS